MQPRTHWGFCGRDEMVSPVCAALYPFEFELLQLQKGVAEMVVVAVTMPSGWS